MTAMNNNASPLWLLSALFFLAASLFAWMSPHAETTLRVGMLGMSAFSIYLFIRAPREDDGKDSAPAIRTPANDF
ncbi:hypothetical protein P7B02_06255 [Caulobacter segnis]|uniref:hypothetical protein n=1 Tax=Caulobacter segnis TaxID=88688 RepID=UPI00240FE0C3|nr:hypothetical protein [Caulobacter segnis]MDG2521140.1 hypothetical protein [Caulobacter segnis]